MCPICVIQLAQSRCLPHLWGRIADTGFFHGHHADHDRNLPEALKEAETVYKTRKNIFVADTLAWCYYKNGRYEDAKKAIAKALSQNTPDANIRFHAGLIYAKLGDQQAAKQSLYGALSLNPNFHPLYVSVAADTLKQLGTRAPAPVGVR